MSLYKRSANTFTFEAIYRCEISRIKPKKTNNNMSLNPYFAKCTSLEKIKNAFSEMIDLYRVHTLPDKVHWIAEIYQLLPNYMDKYVEPTDSDIDNISQICNILLRNNLVDAYEAIILNSSEKFLMDYVNVHEKPQLLFHHLKQLKLDNLCEFLWNYIYIDTINDLEFDFQ